MATKSSQMEVSDAETLPGDTSLEAQSVGTVRETQSGDTGLEAQSVGQVLESQPCDTVIDTQDTQQYQDGQPYPLQAGSPLLAPLGASAGSASSTDAFVSRVGQPVEESPVTPHQVPNTTSPQSSTPMDEPTPQRARVKYAQAHSVNPQDVTDEILEKNGGMAHWACKNLDLSKRGSHGQQFNRALGWDPEAQAIYDCLDIKSKTRFREEFAMKKG